MTTFNYTKILTQAVDELSESQSYKGLFHQHKDGDPLPSAKSLYKIVELARAIIFPGYFGNSTVNSHTINYHIGVNVETLFGLLTEQILAGLCFGQENSKNATDNNEPCRETASLLAARFISKLPELRRILATDVEAAYYGDPAATCFGEIISCYPAIRAISNYRIAHELLILGVPVHLLVTDKQDICSTIKKEVYMELKSNEYQIECTPYGEYYAFLTDYHQCCTYGETAEEALETLSDIADEFFCEINEVYLAEEFA